MEKQKQEQIERDEELTKMNRVQERYFFVNFWIKIYSNFGFTL